MSPTGRLARRCIFPVVLWPLAPTAAVTGKFESSAVVEEHVAVLRGSQPSQEQDEVSRIHELEGRLQQSKLDAAEGFNSSREAGLRVLHSKNDRNKALAAEVAQLRHRLDALVEETGGLEKQMEASLGEQARVFFQDNEKMRVVKDLDDQASLTAPKPLHVPTLLIEKAVNASDYISSLYKQIADSRKDADHNLQVMTADFQNFYAIEDQKAMELNAERSALTKRVEELEGRKASIEAALRNKEATQRMHVLNAEAMNSYSKRTGSMSSVTGVAEEGWSFPGTVVAYHEEPLQKELSWPEPEIRQQPVRESDHPDLLIFKPAHPNQEGIPEAMPHWSMRRKAHFQKGPPPTQMGPPVLESDHQNQAADAPHTSPRGMGEHKVRAELQSPPPGWFEHKAL